MNINDYANDKWEILFATNQYENGGIWWGHAKKKVDGVEIKVEVSKCSTLDEVATKICLKLDRVTRSVQEFSGPLIEYTPTPFASDEIPF